ncbi:MAG: dihydrolipoyllysine-residue acetyltransferase [Xanthomonadales bacterium]|nr:dihydrolipoyllysine-residue acetyltransferase [Xanthomonadales bacterium]
MRALGHPRKPAPLFRGGLPARNVCGITRIASPGPLFARRPVKSPRPARDRSGQTQPGACLSMADRIEIKVPDIGEFTDIPVIEVLVSSGDTVEADESLITLESDKATMEVPSPAAGVIVEMRVALEDTVSEGDVVAVLEASDAPQAAESEQSEPADTPPPEAKETESEAAEKEPQKPHKSKQPEQAAPVSAGKRQSPPVSTGVATTLPSRVPYASPAIRMFARELGVDLARVSGSGRKQRILREDVTAFVKSVMSGQAQAATPGFEVAPPPKVDFSKFGDIERLELSRINKISAKFLHRNWVTIPHVTHNDHSDVTALEAFRKENKAKAQEQGFKLTPLVFLIKACVAAMKEFPRFNASLDQSGEHLVLKKYFHIGIAVDTPDGLVVPVLRDCDSKTKAELALELVETSQRARDGKLKPQDLQGGCFSISSLGGIGGASFSPIINAPEVAILGVSRSKMEPVWDGKEFQPKLMMPLSLSYDHRVIDGAAAARFTRFLAEHLENPEHLDLE